MLTNLKPQCMIGASTGMPTHCLSAYLVLILLSFTSVFAQIEVPVNHLHLLGDDAVIPCQDNGGSGYQKGVWVKTPPGTNWNISTDNALVMKAVSIGDSGIYKCEEGNKIFFHLLYVVYIPMPMYLMDTLPYNLKEKCSPGLMTKMNTAVGVAMCTDAAMHNGRCMVQVTGECIMLTTPRDGYNWQYHLYLMVHIPPLPEEVLGRVIEDCKKHCKIPSGVSFEWRHESDFLNHFVRDDANWLEQSYNGRCPHAGSYFRGALCLPCKPDTYKPSDDDAVLSVPECLVCPEDQKQPYYGASDCTNRPGVITLSTTAPPVLLAAGPEGDIFDSLGSMNTSQAFKILKDKLANLSLPAKLAAGFGVVALLGLLGIVIYMACKLGGSGDGKEGGFQNMTMLKLASQTEIPQKSNGKTLDDPEDIGNHTKRKKRRRKKKKSVLSLQSLVGSQKSVYG